MYVFVQSMERSGHIKTILLFPNCIKKLERICYCDFFKKLRTQKFSGALLKHEPHHFSTSPATIKLMIKTSGFTRVTDYFRLGLRTASKTSMIVWVSIYLHSASNTPDI